MTLHAQRGVCAVSEVLREVPVVELRILGGLNLFGVGGHELKSVLAQPKRVALLAYLAAATPKRLHRRDSLVALFWPELDQEHARAALRQALHGLRHALGEGVLVSRADEDIGLDHEQIRPRRRGRTQAPSASVWRLSPQTPRSCRRSRRRRSSPKPPASPAFAAAGSASRRRCSVWPS